MRSGSLLRFVGDAVILHRFFEQACGTDFVAFIREARCRLNPILHQLSVVQHLVAIRHVNEVARRRAWSGVGQAVQCDARGCA